MKEKESKKQTNNMLIEHKWKLNENLIEDMMTKWSHKKCKHSK